MSYIHEQSEDINRGVEKNNREDQGAGDQGIMFGYACNETENFIPLALDLSHIILKELAELRRENKEITYLRPIQNLKLLWNILKITNHRKLKQ